MIAIELCDIMDILMNDVAYIGDDLKLLDAVGFSGTPCNVLEYIQKRVDYIT